MLLIDSSAVELAWANLSWKSFLRFFNHRPGRISKGGGGGGGGGGDCESKPKWFAY